MPRGSVPRGGRGPGALLTALQANLEGVTQGVADVVEGDGDQDDADARRVDQPPGALLRIADAVREHLAPTRAGRRHAEAEEAESGQDADGIGDLERRVHDDRPDGVRDDVPHHDPTPTAAHRPTAWTYSARPEGQRLASDEARRHEPGGERHDEHDQPERRVEDRGDDDEQEEDRDGEDRVDDPHHDGVHRAAEEARDRAEEDAENRGDPGREQRDLESRGAAVHEPPDGVVAVRVGTEEVLAVLGWART